MSVWPRFSLSICLSVCLESSDTLIFNFSSSILTIRNVRNTSHIERLRTIASRCSTLRKSSTNSYRCIVKHYNFTYHICFYQLSILQPTDSSIQEISLNDLLFLLNSLIDMNFSYLFVFLENLILVIIWNLAALLAAFNSFNFRRLASPPIMTYFCLQNSGSILQRPFVEMF